MLYYYRNKSFNYLEFRVERNFYLKGTYYYDATNQRTLVNATDNIDGSNEILSLFQTKTEYHYNVETKKCEKHSIDRAWIPVGVPPNATFAGIVYYGSSAVTGANLAAQVFSETINNQGRKLLYTGCKHIFIIK